MSDKLVPLGDLLNAWALGIIPRPPRAVLPTQDEFDDEIERALVGRVDRARRIREDAGRAGLDSNADDEYVQERENALAAFRRRRHHRSTE